MNSQETNTVVSCDMRYRKRSYRNRLTVLKLFIGACLVIASLLVAAQIMNGGFKNRETTEARNKMFATTAKAEPNHEIPPVDAYVPARIETATFALG
jgi:ABC-type lipoprotein release transport system permease subunit